MHDKEELTRKHSYLSECFSVEVLSSLWSIVIWVYSGKSLSFWLIFEEMERFYWVFSVESCFHSKAVFPNFDLKLIQAKTSTKLDCRKSSTSFWQSLSKIQSVQKIHSIYISSIYLFWITLTSNLDFIDHKIVIINSLNTMALTLTTKYILSNYPERYRVLLLVCTIYVKGFVSW
jgi:hypothetical protein